PACASKRKTRPHSRCPASSRRPSRRPPTPEQTRGPHGPSAPASRHPQTPTSSWTARCSPNYSERPVTDMTATTPRHQTTNHRSHDRAARIDEMVAEGYRTADIARALGITSATLYGWAKIHGVALPVPVSVAEGRKDRILELIDEGHTRRRIA